MASKKKKKSSPARTAQSLRDLSDQIEEAVLKGLDKVGLNKKRRKKAAKSIHRRVLKVIGDVSTLGADLSAWGSKLLTEAERKLQKQAQEARRKAAPATKKKRKTKKKAKKKTKATRKKKTAARKRPARKSPRR